MSTTTRGGFVTDLSRLSARVAALEGDVAVIEATPPTTGGGGTTTTTVLPWFNVKEYGASGNGASDDTLGIQAAIDACVSVGGGVVLLPPGVYRTSAPLAITGGNVTLQGSGRGMPFTAPTGQTMGPCVIYPLGTFTGSAVVKIGQAGTPANSLSGVHLSDFSIAGFSLPASVDGIYAEIARSTIERVWVCNPTAIAVHLKGVAFTDAYDNALHHVYVQNAGTSAYKFNTWASDNFMDHCWSFNAGSHGVELAESGNMIRDCYLYANAGKGVSGELYDTKILNCRIQDSNGGIYLTRSASTDYGGFMIEGNKIWNCSQTTDNTTDSININPSVATTGGFIGGNTFFTNEGLQNGGGATTKNRARYHVNIASSNAKNVVIGRNDYLGRNNATSSYGTAAINDDGTSTQTDSFVLAKKNTASSVTGTLTATTLTSITVPGGLMGKNGRLRITALWSITNSANNKTLTVKLGGTSFFNSTQTTIASGQSMTIIANRNSQSAQVSEAQGNFGTGTGTSAVVTATETLSVDQTLALIGQLANTGETITLESYLVEVLPG